MGQDKATLRWGDKSLLDHMIQLLSTVATPVRVVGRDEFLDRIPGKGPLGGILTALESTKQNFNLFLAVDLPLLTPDFLRVFHSRFLDSRKPLLVCRIGGEFPLCLGVRRDLTPEVEQRVRSDNLSIRAFVQESNGEILEEDELRGLDFPLKMFANINTPQDWEEISKRP
jgi:molybdopterin-guanine dinucleotide biosynthesis protein A